TETVARLGGFLYIDSGRITQYISGDGNTTLTVPGNRFISSSKEHVLTGVVNSTLSIPLNLAWTNSTLKMNQIEKKRAPSTVRGALWVEETSQVIYHWGDNKQVNQSEADTSSSWSLATDGAGGGSWQRQDAGAVPQVLTFEHAGGGAYATCAGIGYLLGGAMTDPNGSVNTTSRWLIPGLLEYNMTGGVWKNQSATSFSPHGTSLGAEAVCVPPYGSGGLVLLLGGLTSYGDDWINGLSSLFQSPGVSFSSLSFFDPSTERWYSQRATGTRPTPRHEFCAVGIQGPLNTYEIYVYGGLTPVNNDMLRDLYVLSIPGFVWFKTNYTSTISRGYHRCVATGDSQMVVVGGWVDPAPDPWAQGIGVFDLPSTSEKSSYDPKAASYQSPSIVQEWYRNG
ncbi:hypothetical protein GQ53DRAFT_635320, partial [Thozetella sp. PMI_491]